MWIRTNSMRILFCMLLSLSVKTYFAVGHEASSVDLCRHSGKSPTHSIGSNESRLLSHEASKKQDTQIPTGPENVTRTAAPVRRVRRARPRVSRIMKDNQTSTVCDDQTSGPEDFRQFVELLGLRAHTTDEVIDQVYRDGAKNSGGRMNFTMCAAQVKHSLWFLVLHLVKLTMCFCVCVHNACIYAYAYTQIQICMHACIPVYVVYTYIHTHIHALAHVREHLHVHVRFHACAIYAICTNLINTHVYECILTTHRQQRERERKKEGERETEGGREREREAEICQVPERDSHIHTSTHACIHTYTQYRSECLLPD
jgi:hypothetical protein